MFTDHEKRNLKVTMGMQRGEGLTKQLKSHWERYIKWGWWNWIQILEETRGTLVCSRLLRLVCAHTTTFKAVNADLHVYNISIHMDLKTVDTNDNWFVILLSCVNFRDWVTKICHFSLLKSNNRVQLRTVLILKIIEE